MEKRNKIYKMMGMMSGTSLDGIDLSLACYSKNETNWVYQSIMCKTFPYNQQDILLLKSMENHQLSYLEFREKEIQYSQLIVKDILQFVEECNQKISIKIQDIDGLSMHGHTVFHQPSKGLTVQVGNLQLIAAKLKLDVIGNFRELDVHRGGQGAPLAPYGEQIFKKSIYLNLGGIANVGYEGKGNDIVFCNMVLNKFAQKIEEKPYDKDGKIGKSGVVDEQYFKFLKEQYRNVSKRSLARQQVEPLLLQIANSKDSKDALRNKMRTYYEFIACQIINCARSISLQQGKDKQKAEIYCTGGGAYNKFLIELLNSNSSNILFILPNEEIIQFKEAFIFGLLGVKFLQNQKNCEHGIGGQLVKGKVISKLSKQ